MLMSEHTGSQDHRGQNLVRDLFMGLVLTLGAIILFPVTLLALVLRALGAVEEPPWRRS
jgi:hypothetical protein